MGRCWGVRCGVIAGCSPGCLNTRRPCAEDSPIYPHMGALGYEQYGRVMFNLKRVA